MKTRLGYLSALYLICSFLAVDHGWKAYSLYTKGGFIGEAHFQLGATIAFAAPAFAALIGAWRTRRLLRANSQPPRGWEAALEGLVYSVLTLACIVGLFWLGAATLVLGMDYRPADLWPVIPAALVDLALLGFFAWCAGSAFVRAFGREK